MMRAMSRLALLSLVPLALGACPAAKPIHDPGRVDDLVDLVEVQLRFDIAMLEARRGSGTDELVERATHGKSSHERALAVRGLGRIGGKRALTALRIAVADADVAVATAAAGAIGIAASLDDPSPDDVAALLGSKGDRAVVIEALGRVAPGPIPEITDALHIQATAEAAALACGRLGRRKIALDVATRDALATLANTANPATRYAAVYALSREVVDAAAPSERAIAVLTARLADAEPEIRATAIAGLAKHLAIEHAHKEIEAALLDRDWRVAIEAVRALTGDRGDDAGRDATAVALVRRYAELEKGTATEAQVVIEGLRDLAKYGARPLVVTANASLLAGMHATDLSHQWIACLAMDGLAHASNSLGTLAPCTLPEWLRLPLFADAGVGTLVERRDLLAQLLANKDVRVRVAALPMFSALWKESDAADHRAGIATVASALASTDPILAGAAVDAAGGLYDLAQGDDRAALEQAIVVRATLEAEPELSSSLLDLVADKKLASGVVACRTGLTGHPVRAKAAAKCLAALGEAVPTGPVTPATAPPVDLQAVLTKRLEWHLATDRGEVVIKLAPEVAPWAVATIVALTKRGFYDHLAFHRVVPNFVVQGGDPTETGGGGPGFTLPSEPAIGSDGAGFATGGIGMADAGRDSGGSQWFAMHGRAPHLDGRYTWVGVVVAGQAVADALQIGDRVVRATIVESAAPR